MFKPNSKVSYNKRNYYVVLDHIIVNDELVDDESQFVSSKQKITDDLEISFINHYNIIEQNNPVGFWQSVLSNHSFDYSNNFKCQIKIDDSESHFISFDVNKGIKIHTDANLIDLNQFNLIQIDFDGFTNFEIIKTQQQIKQDKNQLYRNLLLKHLPVYAVIFGSIFAYYQYEKNIFVQRNERLLSLKAEAFDLQSNIERIKDNVISSNIHPQQEHIKNLLHILGSGITIQKTDQENGIMLTEPIATITVGLNNLRMLKYIAKSNSIHLKISRKTPKGVVDASWKIEGKK